MSKAKLFLIPSPMGDSEPKQIFPEYNWEVISKIKFFLVENIRTARRFLKLMDKSILIDELHFEVLDKRTPFEEYSNFLEPIKKGFDVGVISEAGCPGIADPGAEITLFAHQNNITIVPLIGPSSILIAQMASGLNGQSFAFNGYLPIKGDLPSKELRRLEIRSRQENQSQIFIEAPYRNMQVLETMLKVLSPNTKLCIASGLTTQEEYIKTRTIKQWKGKLPSIHKIPTIFLFLA
jgi:16S rRNA (cytidine1402-2'-O)-methyltransferase